jgi:Papain family cysteine protease
MHFRIRSLEELRAALYRAGPVMFAVPIYPGWFKAPGGVIMMPSASTQFTENHALLAVGYDDNVKLIKFINCWGRSWGDQGFGFLPYKYFEKCVDAWYLINISPLMKAALKRGNKRFLARRFAFQNPLGHLSIMIDLWDLEEDVRIGWMFASIRKEDGWLEIEDLFIRPDHKEQPGNLSTLVSQARSTAQFFGCPIAYWIPHPDTHCRCGNFTTVNDFIRQLKLKVVPSGMLWAPYVAFEEV